MSESFWYYQYGLRGERPHVIDPTCCESFEQAHKTAVVFTIVRNCELIESTPPEQRSLVTAAANAHELALRTAVGPFSTYLPFDSVLTVTCSELPPNG